MSLSKLNEERSVAAGLEASSNLSKALDAPGKLIKPCVAIMLEKSFIKGDFTDRSRAANILASEMKILGKEEEYALHLLSRWNEKNVPPLRHSALSSTVRTAYRYDYRYGCNNEYLREFCIGPEMCPHNRIFYRTANKYTDNRLFFKYRWPELLTNVEKCIYFLALIELERIRGIGAGGKIIASHRSISKLAGIEPKYAGKGLSGLQRKGLIVYKPGIPRKWEGKASEIQRIIPIPKPSRELMIRLERESNDRR